MKGKMILVEGTDCSGKETQSKLLEKYLNEKNIDTIRISFPDYNSATGKIIGGPYLGKEYICDCWFEEGAVNVDPKVSSLYYAADRLYHLKYMENLLNEGKWIILDRYVYSNLAHQGCKILDEKERLELYEWIINLEFGFLGLPDPDLKILLHMPYQYSNILKKNRKEKPDQHEKSESHLKNAEKSYLEIAKLYNFNIIECVKDNNIKNIDEINNDLIKILKKHL